ncbi:unnamed protein product [Pleuronectes platessa]|uniref:Uncharacterized protein n=1 Tax=Pleuronectes platessa TaxID=8262 RepID=A0A9N7VQP0_PLEPL|nr:unnamed protein product [Pleuronectes platessa]
MCLKPASCRPRGGGDSQGQTGPDGCEDIHLRGDILDSLLCSSSAAPRSSSAPHRDRQDLMVVRTLSSEETSWIHSSAPPLLLLCSSSAPPLLLTGTDREHDGREDLSSKRGDILDSLLCSSSAPPLLLLLLSLLLTGDRQDMMADGGVDDPQRTSVHDLFESWTDVPSGATSLDLRGREDIRRTGSYSSQ